MRAIHITAMHRRERSADVEKMLLYGVFGLLLFGPLAFGAVEPWSMFAVEMGSLTLLLLWIAKQFMDGAIKVKWNPLFLPMGVFGTLVTIQFIFRLTAYPHDTMSLALLYFSYAILCFLSNQILVRGAQARSLTIVFSVYGTALACFALIQGISSNGKLYWIRLPRMGGWIYGPYVNHNHYAGLMEMLVPVLLMLSLTRMAAPNIRATAGVSAAVMVGTVFLSGSRGGMLSILAELILLAALLVWQKRGVRTAIGIGVFLAIVVALLAWTGGDELVKRMTTIVPGHPDLSGDFRAGINRDAIHMFLKKPILGWGLGSFPVVYPQFRTFYTNFFINQAHNDYLQLLVETGVLGFGVMVWFVLTIYFHALKKIGDWTADISGAVTLACLLGVTGILVHSAVDFNLEIPANAALFYVLCTVAASEPFATPARRRHKVHEERVEELPAQHESLQQSATNF